MSVNSPWEGPEQDTIYCFSSHLLFCVVGTAPKHLRKSALKTAAPVGLQKWCYHDMTDWVSETTLLK